MGEQCSGCDAGGSGGDGAGDKGVVEAWARCGDGARGAEAVEARLSAEFGDVAFRLKQAGAD